MKEWKAYHRPDASLLGDPQLKDSEDWHMRWLLDTLS